jgi:hypothetical protein
MKLETEKNSQYNLKIPLEIENYIKRRCIREENKIEVEVQREGYWIRA